MIKHSYNRVLYITIPFYTILYYTILHFTMLYYSILYYAVGRKVGKVKKEIMYYEGLLSIKLESFCFQSHSSFYSYFIFTVICLEEIDQYNSEKIYTLSMKNKSQ